MVERNQIGIYQTGNQLNIELSPEDYDYADFTRSRYITFRTFDSHWYQSHFICIPCDPHGAPMEDIRHVITDNKKYGQWVWDENGNDWGLGAWRCSVCHGKHDGLPSKKYIGDSVYSFAGSRFCPCCGIAMKRMEEVQ